MQHHAHKPLPSLLLSLLLLLLRLLQIVELSRLVTQWAVSPECHLVRDHSISGVTRYHYTDARYSNHPRTLGANTPSYGVLADPGTADEPLQQGVYVCTGGGPGFMEAANRVSAL